MPKDKKKYICDMRKVTTLTTNLTKEQEHEHMLAVWCDEQCEAYKKGLLTKYQIEKLEALPYWHW